MEKTQGKNKYTFVFFVAALVVAGFLHSWNMLNFPYYESDEGTYISQAWSLVKDGTLSPYTYWYDHPPMGWNVMALWTQIFGGNFFVFGNAIDMGRVLMLVVHLVSSALIFYILRKVTRNSWLAFLGVLLFSVSPLAIYFQRRFLLDNLMTAWVLASVAMLFVEKIKLRHYIGSGVFFALAVLTKVTSVMFGPVILAFVFYRQCAVAKSFRTILWLTVSISVFSLYILYAILRGEFLPQGMWSDNEHVSLISSVIFQAGRASGAPFWQYDSDFLITVRDWIKKDAVWVMLSGLGTLGALIASYWYRNLRFFVGAILFYVLFLIRGGVVINFYLIPLVPFVAIIIPVLLFNLSRWAGTRPYWRVAKPLIIAGPLVAVVLYYGGYASRDHFVRDETSHQQEAVRWVKENLPEDAAIVIDAYALVDLWDPTFVNEKSFRNADWFYKINRDPRVRDVKYKNNWRNFDYIMLTHEMLKQIEKDEHPTVKEAYQNSFPVAKWIGDSFAYVDEQKFISTNGDWAMVFQVNGTTKSQLLTNWNYYKEKYIHSYGQVIDPSNNLTTSEGQSYAMLRAAWMNDKEMFKGAWLWTRDHLQFRLDDKLFSWKWEGEKLVDSSNATDADQDIAAALLFGHKLWDEPEYLRAAQEIINDIWDETVIEVNGRLYLLPMHRENAERWNGYLFNPSYLSPMWYRIFAEVDPAHDWNRLAADSYATLNDIGRQSKNKTYLPPDWLLLNKKTGALSSASEYFDRNTDTFGFDAFRTLWRASMDYQWFASAEAWDYLQEVNKFLVPELAAKGSLPPVMTMGGTPRMTGHSLSTDAGYLSALMHHPDKDISIDFYQQFFEQELDASAQFWRDGTDYYAENWAWFSFGLYNNNLPNLWQQEIMKR